VIQQHFLDSLSCVLAKVIRPDSRLLDIGAGAGFPGIPLKIYQPDLHVTAVDAVAKKIVFLRQICRLLDLQGVDCVAARLEPQSPDAAARAQPGQRVVAPEQAFDVVVSRAVGAIPYLLQLAAPFLAANGQVLLQRGHADRQAIATNPPWLRESGFQAVKIVTVNFSFCEHPRDLILFAKFSASNFNSAHPLVSFLERTCGKNKA